MQTMPNNCVCDPAEWSGSVVNEICDNFVGDGDKYTETCIHCEHGEACHKESVKEKKMTDKFYMVIRETGGSAPSKRHMMEDEAIKEASRLATQTQEKYFVLATIGVVAPVVVQVEYTQFN